jgi:AcrR family transcriptional regulator
MVWLMKNKSGAVEKNMRIELLHAAAKLFRKKGFHGTSMQDIAEAVGILKGSIYYHFNSKNEIFREVLIRGINPVIFTAEMFLKEEIPPREKLRKLLHYHLMYILEHNDSLVIFFQEREKIPHGELESYLQKRSRYEETLKIVLDEGVKSGEFPAVDVQLTMLAIFGMCNWVVEWYNPNGSKSAEEIAAHMVHLICDLMLNV